MHHLNLLSPIYPAFVPISPSFFRSNSTSHVIHPVSWSYREEHVESFSSIVSFAYISTLTENPITPTPQAVQQSGKYNRTQQVPFFYPHAGKKPLQPLIYIRHYSLFSAITVLQCSITAQFLKQYQMRS